MLGLYLGPPCSPALTLALAMTLALALTLALVCFQLGGGRRRCRQPALDLTLTQALALVSAV